jgi:hypothetical protein
MIAFFGFVIYDSASGLIQGTSMTVNLAIAASADICSQHSLQHLLVYSQKMHSMHNIEFCKHCDTVTARNGTGEFSDIPVQKYFILTFHCYGHGVPDLCVSV